MLTELKRAIAEHIPLGFLTEREVNTWKRKAGRKLHLSETCSIYESQKSPSTASRALLLEITSKICGECQHDLSMLLELEERKLVVQAAALAKHKEELGFIELALERARMSPEERAGLRFSYHRGRTEDGAPRTVARAAKLQAELEEFRRTRTDRCQYSRCRDVHSCTGASSQECRDWASSHPELLAAFEELSNHSGELTKAARRIERQAAELARDPRDESRLAWYLAALEVHKRHAGHTGLQWSVRDTSPCPAHLRKRAKVLEVEQRYHFGRPSVDGVVVELWQRFAGVLHPTQGEGPESLEAALLQGRGAMREYVQHLKWQPPHQGSWTVRELTLDEQSANEYARAAWHAEVNLVIEELGELWSREIREIVSEAAPGGETARSLVALCNTGRRRLTDSPNRSLALESVLRYEIFWVGDGENLLAGGLTVLPAILARAISPGGVLANALRGVEITAEVPSEEVILTASALLTGELIQVEANEEAAGRVREAVSEVLEAAACALS